MEAVEIAKVFAGVFGGIVALPIILLAFKVGKEWGVTRDSVASTAKTARETCEDVRDFRDAVNPRLAKIEFILSGPDGENGLRLDVRETKERVAVIEQRIGPADRRNSRRKTDRRRAS